MTKAKNEVFISLLGGYIMKNIFFFRGGGPLAEIPLGGKDQ